MNEYFYYDCNNGVVETPEERASKRKNMKGLFSRVFLALFIYTMIAQLLPVGLYVAASYLMPREKYLELANSYTVSFLVSMAVQYLIAFPVLLLSLIGVKKVGGKEKSKLDFKELFVLAIATSIDALAVGLTFALYPDVNIVPAISIIGAVTFVICAGGVLIGHKFGAKFKSKAEFCGGLVLVIIGTKLLIEGLLA